MPAIDTDLVVFPTAIPSPKQQASSSRRRLSISSRSSRFNSFESSPVLTPEVLHTRTRGELESLLLEADVIIREKEEKLAIVAKVGQSLLQHNNELKSKHDSLVAKLSERTRLDSTDRRSIHKVPSLVLSPAVASFLGTSTTNSRNDRSTSSHLNQFEHDAEWKTDEDDFDDTPVKSISPRTSPVQQRLRARNRKGSIRSSISSVLSLSDLVTQVATKDVTPHSLAALHDLNQELSQKVEQLQVDIDRAETNARKQLRKQAKELSELKEEHERALFRNEELQAKLASPQASNDIFSPTLKASKNSISHSSISDMTNQEDCDSVPTNDSDNGASPQFSILVHAFDAPDEDEAAEGEDKKSHITPQRPLFHPKPLRLSNDSLSMSTISNTTFTQNTDESSLLAKLYSRISSLESSTINHKAELEKKQAELDSFRLINAELEDVIKFQDEQLSILEEANEASRESIWSRHPKHSFISPSNSSQSLVSPSPRKRLWEQQHHRSSTLPESPSLSRSLNRKSLGSELGRALDAAYESHPDLMQALSSCSLHQQDASTETVGTEEAFEEISPNATRTLKRIDYWPVSLRARYNPKWLIDRLTTRSLALVFGLILWSRFLMILLFALFFALRKGPPVLSSFQRSIKKTQ